MTLSQHDLRIFSNGSEFDNWESQNCVKCKLSTFNNGQVPQEMPKCEIEFALTVALLGYGLVTPAIKNSTGIGNGGKCVEFEMKS